MLTIVEHKRLESEAVCAGSMHKVVATSSAAIIEKLHEASFVTASILQSASSGISPKLLRGGGILSFSPNRGYTYNRWGRG